MSILSRCIQKPQPFLLPHCHCQRVGFYFDFPCYSQESPDGSIGCLPVLCFLKHKHLRSPQCLKTFPITDMIKPKFFTQLSSPTHSVVMNACSPHDGPCSVYLCTSSILCRRMSFSPNWSNSSGISSSWKHLNFPVWVTSLLCILGSLPACNTLQVDPFNAMQASPLSLFFI